jgi:hypothetical protein
MADSAVLVSAAVLGSSYQPINVCQYDIVRDESEENGEPNGGGVNVSMLVVGGIRAAALSPSVLQLISTLLLISLAPRVSFSVWFGDLQVTSWTNSRRLTPAPPSGRCRR